VVSDDLADDDPTPGRHFAREVVRVDADALDALRLLARRVAMADRIAQRTTERATSEVAERLADIGVGMAVHPATIRERGDAVLVARSQLTQAEQLLEAHDANAAEDDARAALPEPPPIAVAPVVAPPRARKRGVFGFLRRSKAEAAEDTTESTELLRSIGAAADDVFGARRATAARDEQRTLLVVRRNSALEVVRVAEHAWYDLAGEGADPTDVEAVVRRLDPQYQDALLAAREMASVRAATAVLDDVMTEWRSAWAELRLDAPLPADAESAVEALAERDAQAEADEAEERRLDLTQAEAEAAVVVVDLELAES
jgi:hypothetical protein